MRGWINVFAVWIFLGAACAGPGGHGPAAVPVGPDAVWRVTGKALAEGVKRECDAPGETRVETCLQGVMEDLGAGPEVIRFSAAMGGAAFLHAFQETGPVDVGWILYPFRANERLGCCLLNGSPGLVDVDDPDHRPKKALKEQAEALNAVLPVRDLSVWPGDRLGPGHVAVTERREGGLRFIAGYVLRDGCHACETVGSAEFAFDFDGHGTFLGTEVASLGRIIHTEVEATVTLSLKGAEEGDGSWQAVHLPSRHDLRLQSKTRVPSRSGQKIWGENWSFRAIRPGRVLVTFRRHPSSHSEGPPDALASFLVVIHEDRETMNARLKGVFSPVVEARLKEMDSPRAGKVDMEVVGVHGDVARVDIRPKTPESRSSAIVYLRWEHGTWHVSGMAQRFDPAFLAAQGIPLELQGPVETGSPYIPLSADDCTRIRDAVSKALNRAGAVDEGVCFEDYAGKTFGEACRITWTGTGEVFPGMIEVARSIREVLEGLGWVEDAAYSADGPLGTGAGFRREDALILLRVLVEPAEEAGLLSNRPISMGELPPEDWAYTITLDGVMQPRGD